MLLFISGNSGSADFVCDSNTSHVIVYHEELAKFLVDFKFKYISCYCLSISEEYAERRTA